MKKIGVFDSGVGGLTVLKSLATHFPKYDFIYVGDTARLPYGTKSPETIRKYSEQIMNYLLSFSVDAIVIACNTASSQVSESFWKSTPVFNVIQPGAMTALQISQQKKIGVLGTRALINSNAYFKSLKSIDSTVQITSVACPLFVPLAEEGWSDDPITNLIAYRYLEPLRAAQVDTAILGCTHYPLLKNSIQKALGAKVQLIDSGEAISKQIENYFSHLNQNPETQHEQIQKLQIELTDYSVHTHQLCENILRPLKIQSIDVCNLNS